MPLDMQQAIAQYGTLGALAQAIPDLKALLEQGAREDWTPDLFFAKVQQTGWWRTSSETRRQAAILQQTDPQTWQQTLENTAAKISSMASEMGVSMSQEDIIGTANHVLVFGVSDDQLRNAVGSRGSFGTGGQYQGAAAELAAQVKRVYSSYGVPYSEQSTRGAVNAILNGTQTLATWENQAREQAKLRYPTLAQQIDQGLTVKDAASPYIAQMAQTLEVNENDVDLTDNYIQRALSDANDKGERQTMPLWKFERSLKDDPRWDKTTNAKNQTYDMLQRIGQDLGFSA